MHNFRKLEVYTRSRVFAREIYLLTARVRRPEHRSVTTQLRNSALGISATIAEGCGKSSRAETIRFLEMASGSTAESEHHLGMASDLAILPERTCAELTDEAVQLRRMIRALITNFPR